MPSIDFSVYCDCGKGMCNDTAVGWRHNEVILTIEPCDKCGRKEYDKGYEDGYKEGYDEGYQTGIDKGKEN